RGRPGRRRRPAAHGHVPPGQGPGGGVLVRGELLAGGAATEGVVRVGDTVRRPAGSGSRLMRDVLLHLERVGFDAAPRWLGLDEEGRDVLSWIDGDTFTERS